MVFVGDRGMVKSKGKQALNAAGLRYIGALTDPQIRKLLGEGRLQLALFAEEVCEVEAEGIRYVLRKNEDEARRQQHRLEDKLEKLQQKMAQRNAEVAASRRCKPEAGIRKLRGWIDRHKLTGLIELQLEAGALVMQKQEAAMARHLELAGCYVVTTDVSREQMSAQAAHDHYLDLQKVERDFRTLKTGLLEVRPVWVRKETRTRGHVFCCFLALKIGREMEHRLHAAFGTTDANPQAITLPDALAALSRLCLQHYEIDEKTTVTRLPRPDARQREILKALDVSLPQGKV